MTSMDEVVTDIEDKTGLGLEVICDKGVLQSPNEHRTVARHGIKHEGSG
jgi:hypothetical protein